MIEVSVVICFRDWGLDRLALALRSHAESTLGRKLEVIVSDYGSTDAAAVRRTVERHGAIYARTDVDGPWSRSRALNAGAALARGLRIVTTDADMLFTPKALETIIRCMDGDRHSVQLLQCRDLLPHYSAETIRKFAWDEYESNSVLRPRWGMGGMIAFPAAAYEGIRGYDERMEIYGGEDIDFAHRLRRAGYRLNWIDDPDCRIFHVWHESSRKGADETHEGRAAIARNRDIVQTDGTWVRNLHWKHARPNRGPLATVAIATHNRAEFLGQCIRSVLFQSVEDIELMVVDDGSSDHTRDVVSGFKDSRIRYVRQEALGVSTARNRALAEARAPFIVIQDDDDIMLPWRIEAHFDALVEGVHGTYGGWVDFDDATGKLTARPGREFGLAQILYSSGVMAHGTLMMRAELLRKFGYNASMRAGTDFNLAIRMAMNGIQLKHTGQFHILRRFHGGNLTETISDHQKESARKTTNTYRRRFGPSEEKVMREAARAVPFAECKASANLMRSVGAYLPDELVRRIASVRPQDNAEFNRLSEYASSHQIQHEVFRAVDSGGNLLDRIVHLSGVTLEQLRDLQAAGLHAEVEAVDPRDADPSLPVDIAEVTAHVVDEMTSRKQYYCVIVCESDSPGADLIWSQDAMVRRLVVVGRKQFAVAVRAYDSLAEAAECAAWAADISVDCLLLQPTL